MIERDLPRFDAILESQWLNYQEAMEVPPKECNGCWRLWEADELDKDGYCRSCAEFDEENDTAEADEETEDEE